MVRHWITIQQNKKIDGSIHIGAYVTLIADHLGVSTKGFTLSRRRILLDAKAYQSVAFIKIERGPANHPDRYLWRMPNGTQYPLPIRAPLSPDEHTWLFTGRQPANQVSPSPRVPFHPPSSPIADVDMTDVPSSSHQVHASTFTADPSHPPEPTIIYLYSLISAMHATQLDVRSNQLAIQATLMEQGDTLHDIRIELSSQGSRLGALEEQMQDLCFYEEHGY